MPALLANPRRSPWWRVLLAVVCVLLVIAVGTVQAVHVHSDGTTSHADCSLCGTAHVSVQVLRSPVAAAPVVLATYIEPSVELRAAVATPVFALFTRPPPSA